VSLRLFQVDAFTDRPFGGNPAAVVPLDAWLPEDRMRAIAAENNLSETAFFVPSDAGGFDIRWFTPAVEADLCGHATLATAWVLFNRLNLADPEIAFHSRGGTLRVARDGDRLAMDFPALPPTPGEIGHVENALGATPEAVLVSQKNMAVLRSADQVRTLTPDFRAIAALDKGRLIVTAPGDADGIDFVSRYFAPYAGIDEDPVTGSAHCVLVPHWADRLGKTDLVARQVSARSGTLWCRLNGDRVTIAGHCAPYLEGTILS